MLYREEHICEGFFLDGGAFLRQFANFKIDSKFRQTWGRKKKFSEIEDEKGLKLFEVMHCKKYVRIQSPV